MPAVLETIELPVQGMTCDHCVSSVQRALEGVTGVQSAAVVLKPGTAKVIYDSNAADLSSLQAAIERAGYSVSTTPDSLDSIRSFGSTKPVKEIALEDWNLAVGGMHCASCVGRVEEALRKVPGVRSARVNLATERASVTVDPLRISEEELTKSARAAGYTARRSELTFGTGADSLRRERAEVVAFWRTRLIIGVLLTVPMIGMAYAPNSWRTPAGWAMLPLATILMIDLGQPYMIGAWKRLMQGASNMDTLISLGTLTAYFYSLFYLIEHNPLRRTYLSAFFLSTAYGLTAWGGVRFISYRHSLKLKKLPIRAAETGGRI